MHVQLLINMFHVKSNRVDAYAEFAGSCFNGVALGEQLQESEFMGCEVVVEGLLRPKVPKKGDDTIGDFRRHRASSLHCFSQIFEQAGEKMQQLQRDTAERTMQVLDEEQAAALKAEMEAPKP